ncbi:hypothetical protein K6L10_07105 [Vibrio parahaemolyticus]|uniref:hypothetical protein n=1 Tax=Vibrio parahaemolyticus TaxID=670 RepID=UPI001C92E5FF|nr:hypothetical protein [Vibrio parahaemolyticus]MBY4651940.1 hypothetical protein [Vibrio parahaemolyticus]
MGELKLKSIRIDRNLYDAIESICINDEVTFSEFTRKALLNDGVVFSNLRNISFKKQYVLSKIKNLTSQYRRLIWESNNTDELNFCLDLAVDKIESIIVEALKVQKKEVIINKCKTETISFIPSEEKRKRNLRLPVDIVQQMEGYADEVGSTFTEQLIETLESVKFVSSDDINNEERKLVEIVRFGNCINAYLKTLHTKRKSSGLSITDYRDLEFKLEMFLSILVHKLAMVGIERQ